MSIGERIIKLREEKGWSQRELSKRVDLNASVMNRIESGERPIKDKELDKIATVLGVTADFILGRSEHPDLTENNEKDIAKRMAELKRDLSSGDGMSFHGEPISPEAVETLLEAIEYAERQTTRINKKYIPKKFRGNKNK